MTDNPNIMHAVLIERSDEDDSVKVTYKPRPKGAHTPLGRSVPKVSLDVLKIDQEDLRTAYRTQLFVNHRGDYYRIWQVIHDCKTNDPIAVYEPLGSDPLDLQRTSLRLCRPLSDFVEPRFYKVKESDL